MPYLSSIFFHLTDYCNENCSFCFARAEMTQSVKKKMDFNTFCKLAKKLKREGTVYCNFLGGEPTLHPEFPKILKYALKHFFIVRIFTNGLFTPKVRDALLSVSPRVYLVVNISTPGFQFKKGVREIILDNMRLLAPKTPITLSVVDSYLSTNIISFIDGAIDSKLLKQVYFKLNVFTPLAKDRNIIKIEDFPRIGGNVCKIIEYLEKKGPPKMIRFNQSYRPCMFSDEQRAFLKKRDLEIITKQTKCHSDGDWFHINTDLKTFKCYSLSTIDSFQIDENINYNEIGNRYKEIFDKYHKELILPYCRSCKFFGFEEGKCSGPCVAYRINAIKEENIAGLSVGCP